MCLIIYAKTFVHRVWTVCKYDNCFQTLSVLSIYDIENLVLGENLFFEFFSPTDSNFEGSLSGNPPSENDFYWFLPKCKYFDRNSPKCLPILKRTVIFRLWSWCLRSVQSATTHTSTSTDWTRSEKCPTQIHWALMWYFIS